MAPPESFRLAGGASSTEASDTGQGHVRETSTSLGTTVRPSQGFAAAARSRSLEETSPRRPKVAHVHQTKRPRSAEQPEAGSTLFQRGLDPHVQRDAQISFGMPFSQPFRGKSAGVRVNVPASLDGRQLGPTTTRSPRARLQDGECFWLCVLSDRRSAGEIVIKTQVDLSKTFVGVSRVY
jgi:hypothetical protein